MMIKINIAFNVPSLYDGLPLTPVSNSESSHISYI